MGKSRHMKSVKIGASLFVVFVLSFVPLTFTVNSGRPISGYFRFTLCINNLANFFIYLFVDGEFRVKVKELGKICGKS